jgi:hypothetical protein
LVVVRKRHDPKSLVRIQGQQMAVVGVEKGSSFAMAKVVDSLVNGRLIQALCPCAAARCLRFALPLGFGQFSQALLKEQPLRLRELLDLLQDRFYRNGTHGVISSLTAAGFFAPAAALCRGPGQRLD